MGYNWNQNWNQFCIMSIAWTFYFQSEVIVFGESFKKTIQIVESYPKAEIFVVLLEIFL